MTRLLTNLGLGLFSSEQLATVLVEMEDIVSLAQLKFLHVKGLLSRKLQGYQSIDIIGEVDVAYLDYVLSDWKQVHSHFLTLSTELRINNLLASCNRGKVMFYLNQQIM